MESACEQRDIEKSRYFSIVSRINYLLKSETVNDTIAKLIFNELGNLHDWIDSEGANLLHYSAEECDFMTTRYLVDCGLDVNAQNEFGMTPLMLAVRYSSEDIVRILLKANAKIDIVDSCGCTVFRMLFDSMYFIDGSTIPGLILMKLANNCETEEEVAEKLINVKCPLHIAVMLRSGKITKFYLDRGFTDDVFKEYDLSALHVAVHYVDLNNVQILLQHGVDVNIKDSLGQSPLMYVREKQDCGDEHLQILKCLLDQSVELTTTTHYDGRMQVYQILRFCSKDTVRMLLQSYIDLNAQDAAGEIPLHYMSQNKNPGVLELLPSLNFNINYKRTKALDHALHIAVRYAHESSVQLLIEYGANVNSLDIYGKSPLIYAIQCRRPECVEMLLQNGADVQITLYNTLSIFHRFHDKFNVFEVILAHLAILETTGTSIKRVIIEIIDSERKLKCFFDMYKQQLEETKSITIYESLTLFDLLIENEKKLSAYLRNRDLLAKFEQVDSARYGNFYYYRKMRRRVAIILQKLQVRERAAVVLCDIIQISRGSYPTITDKICSYLKTPDLIHLGQI